MTTTSVLPQGHSALVRALVNNHLAAAEALMDAGSVVDAADVEGEAD